MKFSIIVAVFNSENTIRFCLESIFKQTFTDYEIVVVDGGSTDNTLSIIRSFSDVRLNVVSETDSGIYDAFNKGLERCSGEFVTFLGSDDVFSNGFVLEEVASNVSSVDLYSGSIRFVKSGKVVRSWTSSNILYDLLPSYVCPHPGLFVHRDVFLIVGSFDTSYSISGDYEWLLRLKRVKGFDFCFSGSIVVDMSVGGVSSNKSFFLKKIKEDFRALYLHFGYAFIILYCLKVFVKFFQFRRGR